MKLIIAQNWKIIHGLCVYCIREGLHNPTTKSMMIRWYTAPDHINTLIVANTPDHGVVGSGIVCNKSILDEYNGNIGVFVKPEHRRQGIGGEIRDQLAKHATTPVVLASYGTYKNIKFYKPLGS